MARILVADDDPSFRALLADILEGAGHQVSEAEDGESAFRQIQAGRWDLVLADQRMPGIEGVELVRRLRSLPGAPPVVVLTAYGTIPQAVEAVRIGAADYLTKPLASPAALLSVVDHLLGDPGENDAFVTASPRMEALLGLVDQVAPRDVPVLITGESGTGKELVARRLHRNSPRWGEAFVAVNCAALPEALAESELFGHERGAFTGADKQRPGRFEEASGGTLFLDEVGELAIALQAKLLRVLEEHAVRRVGGTRDIEVDVRIVAATNRDLAAEVASGGFRRDLYFRLAVVPVELPPLRERRGDIPALTRHLVRGLAGRHHLPVPEIAPDALAELSRAPWPGNVRELRNVLERALLVSGGEIIRERDLVFSSPEPRETGGEVPLDREERERTAVIEALRCSGGNREEAARLLGISVRTLYYRLRRWGIS